MMPGEKPADDAQPADLSDKVKDVKPAPKKRKNKIPTEPQPGSLRYETFDIIYHAELPLSSIQIVERLRNRNTVKVDSNTLYLVSLFVEQNNALFQQPVKGFYAAKDKPQWYIS